MDFLLTWNCRHIANALGDEDMEDHIVEEIRRIREEHAAQFNYDVDAIFADLKRLGAESKRPHVSFGPRRIDKPMPPPEAVPANK